MRWASICLGALLACPAAAWAGPPEPTEGPPRPPGGAPLPDESDTRQVVVGNEDPEREDRSSSVVTRRQMQERLPRSAPDALRYEPGVYVQKTGHAQASPYVRGLTGQQTLMMFDGVRMNNSTFRSGPNQYFFTVDSRTIQRLEVVRGAASTRYGSDALGGALLTTPIEPSFDGMKKFTVRPRVMMATRTADQEIGGRGQIDFAWRDRLGVIGGVGYRDVSQLRTSGPILSPATGEPHNEPRFENDGRTQQGTGFQELTADARVVGRLSERVALTLAYYDYRQMNAPRTDKCPPAEAQEDVCLLYKKQYRTLNYASVRLFDGPGFADTARLTLSYQRQHEDREQFQGNGIPDIPGGTENNGQDTVHTAGVSVNVATRRWRPTPWFDGSLLYGGDAYYDRIDSYSEVVFTDITPDLVLPRSRGQYLDDSQYLTSGLFVQGRAGFVDRIIVRAGGRVAGVAAQADGDEESNSATVDRSWLTAVGNVGTTFVFNEWLGAKVGVDQGFRAPNLDDLTSRQQTGPGFQFENADLDPEHALSVEAALKAHWSWIEGDVSVFQTTIRDMIARAPRTTEECPETDNSPGGCDASRTRFQLVNLDGVAVIRGAEASLRVFSPWGVGARATISYARGEGPNPVPPPPDGVDSNYRARLPLSRIPPLNGTAELTYHAPFGLWAGTGVRWATVQDRLALADEADTRIPIGGTPGFVVVDMRAGYRFDPYFLVGLVFENVGDVAYRYHGSAVNGPERSVSVSMEFGF